MRPRIHALVRWLCALLVAASAATLARAGGSGLNVVVVVNQTSTNSLALGNDYCEKRAVPPQNLFRITGWAGPPMNWTRADFEHRLLNPLLAMLADRALTNQVEIVLLSMDIPYRVTQGNDVTSTTSALFYGFKTNSTPPTGLPASCSLPDLSSNSYAFSELPFSQARPGTAPTNAFLAMMLTDTTLKGAQFVLDRGVASDATFPTQAVYLARTSDAARSVRYVDFDEAIFSARLLGDATLTRIDTDSTSFTAIRGLLTGLATLSLPTNAFLPGALGDSLTSFGGCLLDDCGQTSLLAFLEAGAAASYGTVVEPCNYREKFPHPLDYFYQLRGFNAVEAYYQSLRNPYQGVLVGEPLSAPYALHGLADWTLTNDSILSGTTNLELTLSATATNSPFDRVDLFVDGTYWRTLTNLPPAQGNVLSVDINASSATYTVPAGASRASVAAGLTAALNARSATTRVQAFHAGDRIELQGIDWSTPGAGLGVAVEASAGTAPVAATALTVARPAFLDTEATGYLNLQARNTPAVGDWLRLDLRKTNGVLVSVSVTNTTAGATIGTLTQNLLNQVNATGALQSSDGVLGSDFGYHSSQNVAGFSLRARSPGWHAARIQATFTCSSPLSTVPSGPRPLEQNLGDLRPRNHLFVGSGLLDLTLGSELDTTQLPDGWHELRLVAYEGTSVRTQTHIARTVQVKNHALEASLSPLVSGTNVTLDTPLRIAVSANLSNISSIELRSTGGPLGTVSNQQSCVFAVNSPALGRGLHPFHALVVDTAGNRYRTQTVRLRLIPPLRVGVTGSPPALTWNALPGLSYDILAASDPSTAFQIVDRLTAVDDVAVWQVPPSMSAPRFYRIKLVE